MNAIANTIARRIRAKGRGWVFTPKDFLDVGTRATVDQTLSRLVHKGVVRRLDRGLYDYPKQHDKLGTLSPGADDLAQAIATKTGDRPSIRGCCSQLSRTLYTSTSSPCLSDQWHVQN